MRDYCQMEPKNKLKWDLKQNSCIFIQENAFENVVWEMEATLSMSYSNGFMALCEGIPPVFAGYPSLRANAAENISIAWRFHVWSFIHRLYWRCWYSTSNFSNLKYCHRFYAPAFCVKLSNWRLRFICIFSKRWVLSSTGGCMRSCWN